MNFQSSKKLAQFMETGSGKVGWEAFLEMYITPGVYEAADTHKFSDEAIDLVLRTARCEDQYHGMARYIASTLHFSGRASALSDGDAISYYESALSLGPHVVQTMALRNLLIRLIVGSPLEQNIELVEKVYFQNLNIRCSCGGRYTAIEWFIEHKADAIALEVLREVKVWLQTREVPNIEEICRGSGDEAEAYSHGMTMIAILSRSENWPNTRDWSEAAQGLALLQAGHDHLKVSENTTWFGPFHNDVDEGGWPIIGSRIGDIKPNAGQQNLAIGAPLGEFAGLIQHADGSLEPTFELSHANDPSIYPVDVDTCVALVFGSNDDELSVDIIPHLTKTNSLLSVRKSVFTPGYIGHTSLGRCLYASDVLVGEVAWNSDKFRVHEQCDQIVKAAWNSLKEKITQQGESKPDNMSPVINVSVKEARFTRLDDGSQTVWLPGPVEMKVRGGYRPKEDEGYYDRDDRGPWLLTDSDYSHIRICEVLTRNYSVLEVALPIFRRLRNLSQLYYSLMEVKQSGRPVTGALLHAAAARCHDLKEHRPHNDALLTRYFPKVWSVGINC